MSTTSETNTDADAQTHVVILAGGKGKRLHPHTVRLPKPLMPIGDTSVLELLLCQLQLQGFRQVTLALSHLGSLIEEVCGDGTRFGLDLRYSREPDPLSTAGPLKLVKGLDRSFLVVNGDILTDLDFSEIVDFHRCQEAIATIVAQEHSVEFDFGIVEVNGMAELESFREKPSFRHLVSIGVSVLEPEALDFIQAGEELSMPDLLLRLRNAGKRVLVYPTKCLWQDIGRPEHYQKAQEIFRKNASKFLPASGSAFAVNEST